MITGLLAAMGGVNLIYGAGMLDLGMTFSYEQLLIDAEIAAMIGRVLKGIPVSDDTLAVDVIAKVKPAGSFLGQRHTVNYMKTEQSHASLFDRTMRSAWEAAGETDIKDRANKMAKEIFENHKPVPLNKDVQDKIRAIITDAEKNL